MPLVPQFGISPMPVSMDIEEKAIPREGDYTSFWLVNARGYGGFTPGAPRVHGRVPP